MERKIKIACVGDSITHGFASSNPDVNSYPTLLGKKLGDGVKVGNFGLSGSTLMYRSFFPYTCSEEYKGALEFDADIIVFMLGTNDSTFFYHRANEADFLDASDKIIESFLALPKNPKIYLCLAPHLYNNDTFNYHIENTVVPLQKQVAEKFGLETIDVHAVLSRPELFIDGVHPTDYGYGLLADTIYEAILPYVEKLLNQ